MLQWRLLKSGSALWSALSILRVKRSYNQRYEKFLMRWGSGLFWAYTIQCISGLTLGFNYTPIFDTGMLAVIFLWWETRAGSLLVRLHSEVANLLFLILYLHLMTKLWTSLASADTNSLVSWMSGSAVLLLTYMAGVTGAIMPCSTLSEVTATIVGSALASLVYIKFDFLETIMVPGLALNEEAIFRTFLYHALAPLAGLLLGLIHMTTLHLHKYTAGGGFERLALLPRFRETRRWQYASRYWVRASGTWLRILISLMLIRMVNVLFTVTSQAVSYSLMNADYWPMAENIDFVLTIPHWYLRPLMGALVTIPHHYLGFIYMGCFFFFILVAPWSHEHAPNSAWSTLDNADYDDSTTTRWDWVHNVITANFFLSAAFTTAIIPTGKYFIMGGAMDGLVYTYWTLLLYTACMAQSSYYTTRKYDEILRQ